MKKKTFKEPQIRIVKLDATEIICSSISAQAEFEEWDEVEL